MIRAYNTQMGLSPSGWSGRQRGPSQGPFNFPDHHIISDQGGAELVKKLDNTEKKAVESVKWRGESYFLTSVIT